MNTQAIIAENQALREQVARLTFELETLKRLIFGQKSERYIPTPAVLEQLCLFVQETLPEEDPSPPAAAATQTITYERRKPQAQKDHPGRNPIPDHFPVEQTIIEPEEDTTGLVKIGEERTETLEYTPASLIKKVTIRPKYAQPEADGITTHVLIAPLPVRPLEKSIAEASLLAHVIIAKFIDHLPFYRQIQRFKRDYNWEPSPSTLGDWFAACCTLLRPLYELMVQLATQSDYLQGDESRIQVLSPQRCDETGKPLNPSNKEEKAGKTHRGWMWVVHAPLHHIVVFNYEKGRTAEAAQTLLDNFAGYLQVDGYSAYDGIAARAGVQRLGCWAHARRKFFDARSNDPRRSEQALALIQQIYAREAQCRHLDAAGRKAYRDEHTRPLMKGFKYWMDEQAPFVTPKSPLGQALTYAQNQWPFLYAILEDGRLELDNNLIENKIRPLALGRKNYLFAGSHDAAQRIAMMYTFLGTCAANGVNPYDWLKTTLEKIPTTKLPELHSLVPGYKDEAPGKDSPGC